MGLKRTIKSAVNQCFICGYIFKNSKEKHIEKIDYEDKSIKKTNTVVLCSKCKKEIQKGLIKVHEISFKDISFLSYFSKLGRNVMYLIKSKIIRTSIKYIKRNKLLKGKDNE